MPVYGLGLLALEFVADILCFLLVLEKNLDRRVHERTSQKKSHVILKGRMPSQAIDFDIPDRLYNGFVYVLELEDECLYVGYTTDPDVRISSHFLGRGAQWTGLHKPLGIKSIQPGDTQLENCLTLALMCKYGWKKVRGGRYLDVNMAIAPPAIRRAYTLRAPAKTLQVSQGELVEAVSEVVAMLGHSVVIEQIKEDGSKTDWRARITGPKADIECPKTGRKTIYGPCEEELKTSVQKWLGDYEDDE